MRPGALATGTAGLMVVALSCASCGGKTVRLGEKTPLPFHFGEPVLVAELASEMRTDNPTLTSDMLEIFFTTNREGTASSDIWFAQRASAGAPFGTPAPVQGVNSDAYETSSAISGDGLTLWFGSDRAGGSGDVDIWVCERPTRSARWSTPMNLVGLNSTASEIPRPPGQHGLVMRMASTKLTALNPAEGNYQSYWTTRASPGSPFGAPVAIPELAYKDRSTVDAFLTGDGLTLFFSSAPVPTPFANDGGGAPPVNQTDAGVAKSDLFVAFRRSTDEPFAFTQPLSDLNTTFDERDPWLSPDGTVFYFTSDRDGPLTIYTAPVLPPHAP
jgi:hypothetical protein